MLAPIWGVLGGLGGVLGGLGAILAPRANMTPYKVRPERIKPPHLGASWAPKSMKNRYKIDSTFDWFFDCFLDRFWSQLGPNLAPKTSPKWSQVGSKIDQKLYHFFDWFLDRFLIDFGSILELKWVPKSIKNRSRHQCNNTTIQKHKSSNCIGFSNTIVPSAMLDHVQKSIKNRFKMDD